MQHFSSLKDVHLSSACLTIGSFDGVHLGHQALIQNLIADAAAIGSQPVVLTFFPHPAVVLRNLQEAYYLSTPEERKQLLFQHGVEIQITQHFDMDLASVGARDFMQMLSNHLGLKRLWVGHDFALGRNREGNVSRLHAIGKELGYTVEVIQPVKLDNDIISSSLIRRHLSSAELRDANRLLGRYYSVKGKVVSGDRRGRGLGFPTANLAPWNQKLLPANGIYATWAVLDGQTLPSVTSIGLRPTFENQSTTPRVETYIFNFDQDIYGQELEIQFVEFLRPELRFNSVPALIIQMNRDVLRSREVLHAA